MRGFYCTISTRKYKEGKQIRISFINTHVYYFNTMPTLSFKVSREQERMINREYKKRGYISRSEFMRAVLRAALEPDLSEETVEAIKKARKQRGEPAQKVWEELGV